VTQAHDHEKVWGMIPWFVNGRLSHEEALAVETHMAECELCRDECALQAKIHDTIREDDSVAFTSEAAYRRLAARIDSSPLRGSRDSRRVIGLLAAALAVESVALVAWGAWTFTAASSANSTTDARYVTLSSPAKVAAPAAGESQVRVVFAPQSTLEDVQGLLRSVSAHVVDGPTEGGVYTLAWSGSSDPDQSSRRMETLRGSSLVRLAEPVMLGAGAAR
jgi:anti-sigma factor RsiW